MKALIGSWDNRPYKLLAEITALRTRVGELEAALAAVSEENERLRQLVVLDELDDIDVAVPTG
jgi:hypothetical protein